MKTRPNINTLVTQLARSLEGGKPSELLASSARAQAEELRNAITISAPSSDGIRGEEPADSDTLEP